MSIEWKTSQINAYVKPPIWTACDHIGPYNGAQFIMKVENLGEFPKTFKGETAVELTISTLNNTYLCVAKIPGILDNIGKGMKSGDDASFAELLNGMKAKNKSIKNVKAASIYYATTGKVPKDEEIKEIIESGVDFKPDEIFPGLTEAVTQTGGNPVVDFFAGGVSGAASYVDETLNGALSVIGWGCGFLRGLTTEGQDPFLEAQKSAYEGATSCNLSGAWDSLMTKTGVVNVNSGAYAAGKVTGNVVTAAGVAIFLPGGMATRAYQVTTAFTTTYGATVRSDVKGMGGIDNIDATAAREMSKHSFANSATAAITSALTSYANSNKYTGAYTAGDLGAKAGAEAWNVGGKKILTNITANSTIAFISNSASQYSDGRYRENQFGQKYEYDLGKATAHTINAALTSLGTNAANMNNSDKSITKYEGMTSAEKKLQVAKEKTINDYKKGQYAYKSKGYNDSLTRAVRSATYYASQEVKKENAGFNNTVKVTSSTVGKLIEKGYESMSNKRK